MKTKIYFTIIITAIIFIQCSSSEQTTKDNEQENDSTQSAYVFDLVEDDSLRAEEPIQIETPVSTIIDESKDFIVQVGAFTTEDRAIKFIDENREKIKYNLSYHFSEAVNLFVVQLPAFNTRVEAETVRNELWKTEIFKDAFIVP